MGRLGPLTSMALGRSPYDDVVYGEGEDDPRDPLQLYDERGRPVNPETKRVNRDIIRSHNEVMLVIGVVESENTFDELRAEHQRRHAHERYDELVGRNLEWAARVCELGGVWGIGGMRQRILLYKDYSHVPFSRLFQVERQIQSPKSLWLHGLPAFVVANALDFPWFADRIMKSTLLKSAFVYMQTSLKLWIFLQRMHLLPASSSPWLPNWKFFIPFTSSSVIPTCPLPSSLNVRSIAEWLGSVALSASPFVAFYVVNGICLAAADMIYEELYDLLPNPSSSEQTRPPGNGFVLQRIADDREAEVPRSQPVPRQEISEVLPAETTPAQTTSGASQDANVWDLPQSSDQTSPTDTGHDQTPYERSTTPPGGPENTPTSPSRPRNLPRRSHASNTEDFSSDDEATEEVVSATLISFDVENNPDNPDPNDANIPPGVWSAELRPNPGNDSSNGRDGEDGPAKRASSSRMYRDNALTQLPASIAAGILARRASSILLAPLEASSLREIAWLWCRARGMSTSRLWEPVWFWPFVWRGSHEGFFGWTLDLGAGFSFGSAINFVGLELTYLLFDACLWSLIPLTVSRYLISEEEWEKRQKAAEQREQAQQQQRITQASDVVQSPNGRDP
ncbi:hypothetical protein N0V93_006183 [Gnomoniopsis smithogilvyi]|uniref:Uncharacterized protein n=1 Tax=Gnomoniopsis smithogilvyi TaxID=1191159 RepID=A0A9W8YNW4_9PEZI|nr:hypothetical protein N0V93_006183 [Gnomoniopsis smithogilvyi]